MKKLLIVASYCYPKVGGLENYVWTICKDLKSKYNWKIVIVTTDHITNKYVEEEIEGIKIYRLPQWFKISNTPINPGWLFDIAKIIKKENPNIINAHAPVPFMADISSVLSQFYKIPFILTYHSGSMKKLKKISDIPIGVYESLFLPLIARNAKNIICVSSYVKRMFNTSLDKIVIVTPGVNTNIFKPNLLSKREKNSIIFVGRIEKTSSWKGIKILLDALKVLIQEGSQVNLSIIGSGDAIDEYKQYSKKLKIEKNISFLGPLKDHALANAYNRASVLVLPSLTSAESFGIVLTEAMACKLPVIGSNVGGIPYVIEDGKDGLLVPANNPIALAKAIKKIIKNRSLANEMGVNGYKKVVKHFTWDKQVSKTSKIFSSL